MVQVTGEFHDKNGVLACQGDHENETDLGVEIAVVFADYKSEKDSDERHRHHQNDRRR